MELRINRLILRDITESDFTAIHKYASDPDVTRYMPWGPNTEDETRAFVDSAIANQSKTPRTDFTLVVTLDGKGVIGGCSIDITDPVSKQGFIGYLLMRQHWGKGYATEIGGALLRFGFQELGLHRIWTTCDAQNIASAHVLEKNNMRREGCLKQNVIQHGEWRDSYLYAVLSTEMIPVSL